MSPKAGAHGELCGLLCIRAALEARGDAREVVLVPESAHGTNPATAAFCGYRVENIPATREGRVDLDALKARLGPDVAAVMITNPNTCGLFEPRDEGDQRRGPCGRRLWSIATAPISTPSSARSAPATSASMRCTSTSTRPSRPRMAAAAPAPGRWCCRRRWRPFGPLPYTARYADGSVELIEEEDARRGDAAKLRPDDRLPRPDGHVHPRFDLHPQPRRRRTEAGRRGCGAQRQLRPAQPRGRARRAVRVLGAVHARGDFLATKASPTASRRSTSPRR